MTYGIKEIINLPTWADELPEELPHGSGIDADWVIEGHTHHITCRNSFHCMDQNGMYEGWQDFSVILKKGKSHQPDGSIFLYTDVTVHFHGNQYLAQKHQLRDYLADTIAYALTDFTWGKGFIKSLRRSEIRSIEYHLEAAQHLIQPHVISGTPSFKPLGEAMSKLGHALQILKR